MHPTPVLLPGKPHGRRSLVGCSPWGREELDMTERLHFHFSLSCTGEGNDNPLQCSCLEHPRDGGAWWAAVCGVAQSRTPLKRLSSSSSACWVQVEEEISGSTSQARRTQTELCFSSLSFMCLAQCLEYKYWMDGKMDHPYSQERVSQFNNLRHSVGEPRVRVNCFFSLFFLLPHPPLEKYLLLKNSLLFIESLKS